jgi:hypothetical protein
MDEMPDEELSAELSRREEARRREHGNAVIDAFWQEVGAKQAEYAMQRVTGGGRTIHRIGCRWLWIADDPVDVTGGGWSPPDLVAFGDIDELVRGGARRCRMC